MSQLLPVSDLDFRPLAQNRNKTCTTLFPGHQILMGKVATTFICTSLHNLPSTFTYPA